MRVLILGVTGMLGSTMFRIMSEDGSHEVFGTARGRAVERHFGNTTARLLTGVDVEQHDSLVRAFAVARPQVVINCIGLVKQLADAKDPLQAVPINTLLPHKLAGLCTVAGARLVHVSTDCVFSGRRGGYRETDFADADDLYGRSKLLGEVDYPHAVTLRTSIIGHELEGSRSLLCWFLAQQGRVKGFTRAVFSGLPTFELARVVRDVVLLHPELRGLYHVAAQPINKYDLLCLIAKVYGKDIMIEPDGELEIDRSLDASRFREATGYTAPKWSELIQGMYEFK